MSTTVLKSIFELDLISECKLDAVIRWEKPDHSQFTIVSKFAPAGDQPKAINQLTTWIAEGHRRSTLLGITGSGKTFTVANTIKKTKKPALVIAHNKTLAGQLCNEFKEFFPKNHVEYFISYYDYYQPESYIPHSDTFIEKTAEVNDNIDRLRHSTTRSIFEHNDIVVVASVSCIYGLGIPELYYRSAIKLVVGETIDLYDFLGALVEVQYSRNDLELARGRFRVRGEIVDVLQVDEERVLRVEFFGDEIERLAYLDAVTGEILELVDQAMIYPAKHYVANEEETERSIKQIEKELDERINELKSRGKDIEAQRLLQRTRFDIEMMKELGYCSGIENYSRILENRKPGSSPSVLIDYFNRRYGNDGWVCYIDESHMTLPQLKAMYNGDQQRKQTLVDYGFRLPCAKDNRPLRYEEFDQRVNQTVYISATPGGEELNSSSDRVTELIIRPTGLLDPIVKIKETHGQVDTLIDEIKKNKGKTIVNTLTKRMAEDLSKYLTEHGLRARYLHSEIVSLERIKLLSDLRTNEFDIIVGVNLLREGIDLPEVSLVCIMDADKEGFLRNYTTLIQMIGRAARNADSKVILFADKITDSMDKALGETQRRRELQEEHNKKYGITPKTIIKSTSNPILEAFQKAERAEDVVAQRLADEMSKQGKKMTKREIIKTIEKLEAEMKSSAKELDFEKAAEFRNQLHTLREQLEEKTV